jgi:predicted transglutaminase-like cysteine proteinase
MFIILNFLLPYISTIDSDNDGVINEKDIFPYDQYESYDSDNDGIGDNADRFRFDPAAYLDSDNDGYPDQWNKDKSQNHSTSNPQLIIDEFPYDPFEYCDSDHDGVGDNGDVFPYDSSEYNDMDLDGIGDNADINSNVDLGFTIIIESFKLNRFVDILPRAQIYFVIKINNKIYQILDNNGKYWKVWLNQDQNIDISVTYDIDDNTNNESTTIEIIAYDKDYLFNDDLVDINTDPGKTSQKCIIYHKENNLKTDTDIKGQQGLLLYAISLSSSIEPTSIFKPITYDWVFKNNYHKTSLNISNSKYNFLLEKNVNRSPQFVNTNEMISYITYDDDSIKRLSTDLEYIANKYEYDNVDTIDFVLTFIHNNIEYVEDINSKNQSEYWKFPIETLVEKQGDCEDSSILFQAIMKNMGYDVVMLFYIIDDDTGHLSTGLYLNESIEGYNVTYNQNRYYYCETTSIGYQIGEKPENIPNKPVFIIKIP